MDTALERAELNAWDEQFYADYQRIKHLRGSLPNDPRGPIDELEYCLIVKGWGRWMPFNATHVFILMPEGQEALNKLFGDLSPLGEISEILFHMEDRDRWQWIKEQITEVMIDEMLSALAIDLRAPDPVELPLEESQIQERLARRRLIPQLETALKTIGRWDGDGPDDLSFFVQAIARLPGWNEEQVYLAMGSPPWPWLSRRVPVAAIESLLKRLTNTQ